MKKLAQPLTLIFVLCSFIYAGNNGIRIAKEKQTLFYSKANGLRLRSEPNQTSKVLGSLVKWERVSFISKDSKLSTVDGIEGYWCSVKNSTGLTGWVFGGYLQEIPHIALKYTENQNCQPFLYEDSNMRGPAKASLEEGINVEILDLKIGTSAWSWALRVATPTGSQGWTNVLNIYFASGYLPLKNPINIRKQTKDSTRITFARNDGGNFFINGIRSQDLCVTLATDLGLAGNAKTSDTLFINMFCEVFTGLSFKEKDIHVGTRTCVAVFGNVNDIEFNNIEKFRINDHNLEQLLNAEIQEKKLIKPVKTDIVNSSTANIFNITNTFTEKPKIFQVVARDRRYYVIQYESQDRRCQSILCDGKFYKVFPYEHAYISDWIAVDDELYFIVCVNTDWFSDDSPWVGLFKVDKNGDIIDMREALDRSRL